MAETADRRSAGVDDAVDRVIRSFTDAEVALRELVASAESFKSSSATMESGRDELATSRAALASTTEGLALLMASVANSATQLQDAATALRAVDQERIWAGFEATGAALTMHDEGAKESTAKIDAQLVAGLAAVSLQVASVREELDASIERSKAATTVEIEAATSMLGAQLHSVVEASAANLSDRIDASEKASAGAIATAHAELRVEQAEIADQLQISLGRAEQRATQILVAAVAAAVFALAGIIVAALL